MEASSNETPLDLYSIFNTSGSVKGACDFDSALETSIITIRSSNFLNVPLDYCRICLEKYDSNYGSWDHSREHAWICSECEFTTDKKEALDVHQQEKGHLGNKVPEGIHLFYCMLCNKCYTSNEKDAFVKLKKHKEEVHHDIYPSYSCNVCDFVTYKTSSYTLIEHERREHSTDIRYKNDQSLRHYQCGSCKRLIVSRSRYKLHEKTHAKKVIEMRRVARSLQ